MSTPSDPTDPRLQSTGGQTPTSEPRGGQTSFDAAGSVRDRLRNPGAQSGGGDTRESEVTEGSFQQTDSREELRASGRDERQFSQSQAPEGAEIQEPRAEDVDPGAARAAERLVSALFVLSFLGVIGFIVTYIVAPFRYGVDDGNQIYTPLLGIFMAMALGGIGFGAVVWAKRLMPTEEAVQERHHFNSDPEDRSRHGGIAAGGTGPDPARPPFPAAQHAAARRRLAGAAAGAAPVQPRPVPAQGAGPERDRVEEGRPPHPPERHARQP